jgi:hypothetical protein
MTQISRRTAALALAIWLSGLGLALAPVLASPRPQAPTAAEAQPVSVTLPVVVDANVEARMRDGVVLRADVCCSGRHTQSHRGRRPRGRWRRGASW